MEDYSTKIIENRERNKLFIKQFNKWLNNKGLTNKTIKKHVSNADLFINEFLNYYDIIRMEYGINNVYEFLDDWFYRKCLWSLKTSLKENIANLKKFYECMV